MVETDVISTVLCRSLEREQLRMNISVFRAILPKGARVSLVIFVDGVSSGGKYDVANTGDIAAKIEDARWRWT